MPLFTPFHSRTAPLCESYEWRHWAGYLAPSLYDPVSHEREYFAIRNSAALIDVTPLFKYEIEGPDAARLIDRLVTRDVSRCAVGQVLYTPWCDEEGKVIDDGTVARLAEDRFRVTAAHPNLRWFQDVGYGLNARVSDMSEALAALALQGPKSRAILRQVVDDMDVEGLRYYRLATGRLAGQPVTVTRTGYTGDLGYELWVEPQQAEVLWDRLCAAGAGYGLLPAGMVALDMARIEAGLLLNEVDYISAHDALIEAQKSSPFELGLGWAVKFTETPFVGRDALAAEREAGSQWSFVGLEVPWFELERLYGQVGLRPRVAGKRASRLPVPIYVQGEQVGQATSHMFSPLLKKYIAIGTIAPTYAKPGTTVELEYTVEYRREMARATVVKIPFFDPPRKRA